MNTLIDLNTLKRCNACKTDKPLPLMVYDKQAKGCYRPLCRECKASQKLAAKQKDIANAKKELLVKPSRFGSSNKLNNTQREALGLGNYVPRKPGINEALAPRINKMAGKYQPPVWNTRAGSDHSQVKSIGMPT